MLQDRIQKIQSINKQHNLLDNAYLSFSGGKDSTVLHYLIDLALPGNNIPRVFINTGIEYKKIVEFVNEMAKKDSRFIILKPSQNIKEVLKEHGYPFKSKEHAYKWNQWYKGSKSPRILKYARGESGFDCSKKLLYQFTDSYKENPNIVISDRCCFKLKKEPVHKWAKENKKSITLTGMLGEEGGNRSNIGCLAFKGNGRVDKFHPLIVVTHDWEDWFIKKFDIELCELYYPPYNFDRTGCKGCPFALKLQHNLDVMEKFFPAERKQCEDLWNPVYTEYRKIGYRLKKPYNPSLF